MSSSRFCACAVVCITAVKNDFVGDADLDARLAAAAAAARGRDACVRCASPFADANEAAPCPACAVVACKTCRGRLVFDVDRRKTIRVCRHCYVESPRIRQGTKRGAVELARDPFFKHRVDWARVARREAEPPYRPNCASDADVGHFDAEFTDEAPRDSDYKPRPGAGDGRGRNRDYFFDLFTLNFSKRGAAAPRDASHCGEFAGFSYNPSHLDT